MSAYNPPQYDAVTGEWYTATKRPLVMDSGVVREMADVERVSLADVATSGEATDLDPGTATEGQILGVDASGNAAWVAAASQSEMEAGTETAIRSMSPLRVKQAIDELAITSADVQTDAADRTEGRIARIDLVPMDPFHEICHIAGMEPTLYLDFASQDYRIYNSATGLERKALTDILDSTIGDIRNSTGTAFNALGLLESQAADVPRLDFDPETGLCRGVLVEESRTNLLTYSQEFDNAAWSKEHVTITANAAVAPDGTLTADKLVQDTSTGYHTVLTVKSVTSGVEYAFSAYVKAGEESTCKLIGSYSGSWVARPSAVVDLSDGSITETYGSRDATIFSVGNGWYRVTVFGVTNTTTAGGQIEPRGGSYTGDGTSGIYIWGAQLEASSQPSSYIPTSGAAATRAADTLTISGTNFSDFYRHGNGTMLATGSNSITSTISSVSSLLSVGESDANNITIFREPGSMNAWAHIRSSGISSANFNGAVDFIGCHTLAFAFSSGDSAFVVDGGSAITSTTTTFPSESTINKLAVGSIGGGINNMFNGHIASAAYFPRRLTNTQLQFLSSLGA